MLYDNSHALAHRKAFSVCTYLKDKKIQLVVKSSGGTVFEIPKLNVLQVKWMAFLACLALACFYCLLTDSPTPLFSECLADTALCSLS